MPLSSPAPRSAQHLRRVHYTGYQREDGLWDIEGELHDSKCFELVGRQLNLSPRPAGAPIHHMWLRVTVNTELVVQAIESAMDAHPLPHCPQAEAALQAMVGCSMARGWRQAIQKNLGGVASCTHLRELLFNLATAAFQSVTGMFAMTDPDEPPRHLGQCTGWDFQGPGVKEYYPQFYGRLPTPPAVAAAAATSAATPTLPKT